MTDADRPPFPPRVLAVSVMAEPVERLPTVLAVPTLATAENREGAAPFKAQVCPPGSKSLTNRAILLAALADGESVLHRPLVAAEDAQRMLIAVAALGAVVTVDSDETVCIGGVNGRWRANEREITLNLNNAGTAVRFLAGAALLSPMPIVIDGNARMRERPIGELGDLLKAMGCEIDYLGGGAGGGSCPPLRIRPPCDLAKIPNTIEVGQTYSSQFISAMLLVAPWLPHGLTVKLAASPTSASYIAMTAGLLAHVGAVVQHSADQRVIRVRGENGAAGLRGFEYRVEPDASGATYFWAAAAVTPGAVCRVMGLDDDSLQGDSDFPMLLRRMGAVVHEHKRGGTAEGGTESHIEVTGPRLLKPILADMSEMPDAAMTLAAVACFAQGTSILRGLRTLRVKETDRIAAVCAELAKIGVDIEPAAAGDPDALTITPPRNGVDCSPGAARVEFETYDDHRMAMSLAIIGLRRPNVFIKNPACVAKTYPTFWRDFALLYR